MFPKIDRMYISTDKINFRRNHYWIESPKYLRYLRRPHQHKFNVQLYLQVVAENREIPCEILNGMLLKAIHTIPNYVPWSCETLGRKILERICKELKEQKNISPEFSKILEGRRFVMDVTEGDSEQGATISGVFMV